MQTSREWRAMNGHGRASFLFPPPCREYVPGDRSETRRVTHFIEWQSPFFIEGLLFAFHFAASKPT
jgi:hypothetical protein